MYIRDRETQLVRSTNNYGKILINTGHPKHIRKTGEQKRERPQERKGTAELRRNLNTDLSKSP